MNVQAENKTIASTIAFYHEGKLKTRPCKLDMFCEDFSKEIDFNSTIKNIYFPEGKYKINIIIEKID